MAIERWEIASAHASIQFAVRHLMIARVRGRFARWSATLFAEDGDVDRAAVEVVIDAASIETGVADRDAHLRSADFFDVANHPEVAFRGARVEPLGGGRFRLDGELAMRGTTRPVALEVELAGRVRDPWGDERAVLSAKTAIDRRELGLTWNEALETGGFLVGDRVEIEIEVEAVKQAATRAA
jgi:polyisoprenoid-binding protein YceI